MIDFLLFNNYNVFTVGDKPPTYALTCRTGFLCGIFRILNLRRIPMKITEQFILLLAPNAAAASNGKKLSQSGKFQARGNNADSNIYWAECVGSGKNPYRTSIDFSISDSAPTCRCSCPSRQFPCKLHWIWSEIAIKHQSNKK